MVSRIELQTTDPEELPVRNRTVAPGQIRQWMFNDPVHDDKWHHVAAVVVEAELPNLHDDVKLYKDGVPADIHDIGLLDLWPLETGDELNVRIGRRFKGLIDDLRIYDRPLSDDEINALFKLRSNRPLKK